jgi:hypothetical protein
LSFGGRIRAKCDLSLNIITLTLMSLHLFALDLDHKTLRITSRQACIQTGLYILYLLYSLAFLISASYFLRNYETCGLHYTSMVLVAVYHGIDSLRTLLALTYILRLSKHRVFIDLYACLGLNGCLGFVTFAYLHRCYTLDNPYSIRYFNPSCSPATQSLLDVYLITYWCTLCFQCVCCCGVLLHTAHTLDEEEEASTGSTGPLERELGHFRK